MPKMINGFRVKKVRDGCIRRHKDFLEHKVTKMWAEFAPEMGDAKMQRSDSPTQAYRKT